MNLSELETLIVGLTALFVGELLSVRIPLLVRLNIPAPVIGGLLAAVVVSIIETTASVSINFASGLRDLLILVFFLSLGLTAKISSLKHGGRAVFLLCVVTVLLLAIQNIIGIGVAMVYGHPPFYGLLAGSVAFVGGPGTALAWAKEGVNMGLDKSELVAISAATFAVSLGALISAPVTGWIVNRHKLKSDKPVTNAFDQSLNRVENTPVSISLILRSVLLIAIAIWLGKQLLLWSQGMNLLLPGFLCALMIGMLIANISEFLKFKLPMRITDAAGDMALQVFLAISLMGLKITELGDIIAPLMTIIVCQIVASVAVAYFILFRLLGRNYDAAVTVGGFLGYAISSMPVAMATMEKVTTRYGASPNAILWITLAGSFFVDLINAFLVKGFVFLLPYLTF